MLLKMFKINKRINSTKLPTNDDLLISGEVTLKGVTSVDKPVFVMACGADDMTYARICNYVEFQGNYFWITELRQLNNTHIEVSCKIDVLATFKAEILGTTAYVMYSASNGNVDTIDSRISPKALNLLKVTSVNASDIFTDYTTPLVFITNTVGHDLVTPYYLTGGELQYFQEKLYAPDFLEHFKQYFTNPLENVVNAKMTAANITGGNFEEIIVGNYGLGCNGHRISINTILNSTYTLKIPWHYSDFRNKSPYTQLTLFLPFVGYVSIDNSVLYNTKELTVQAFVEVCTGNVVYKVYADYPQGSEAVALMGTYNGNCNSDTPLARVTQANPVQMATSAATLGLALATQNPMIGIYGAVNAAESFQQKTQINGSLSSSIARKLGLNIVLQVWSSKTNANPSDYQNIIGLPYFSAVELGTLTGYVQTQNASVQAIAMEEELKEINSMLDRGVYIE